MIEILILEDTKVAGQYRKLLENENPKEWNVAVAYNSQEALNYIEKVDIHIFVFDQRLDNGELGTDIFKVILKKIPYVQGIMLSGMATADELNVAEQSGSCLYLNKKDVLLLPGKIYEAISRYYLEPRDMTVVKKTIGKIRRFPWIIQPIKIVMLSYCLIETKYTWDDDWNEVITARAGQERTVEKQKNISGKVIIKSSTKLAFGIADGLDFEGKIKSTVKDSFEKEIEYSSEVSVESSEKEEIKLKLPEIPSDTSKEFLSEMRYEIAPSYKQYRVHCCIECPCCNNRSFFDCDVFIPNQKASERQISVYSTGKRVVIPL